MKNVLEIKDLSKSFPNKKVLDKLNLSVPENSIFGFVGKNGAGKTTTMKIILALLKADKGKIFLCGEKVSYGESHTNCHIGYLADVPEFYSYMTAIEYLNLCGQIAGLSNKEIYKRTRELLELVGLKDERGRIKTFSRGMRQRLGMAQALISEPKLLICDEPTSALDPIGRKDILNILLEIKGKTTVLFSTHILNDVERVCDQIAFLDQGKISLKGNLKNILEKHSSNKYLIEFREEDDMTRFCKSIRNKNLNLEFVKNKKSLIISFKDSKLDGYFLLDSLSEEKILPLKFERSETSLETIFEEVVR